MHAIPAVSGTAYSHRATLSFLVPAARPIQAVPAVDVDHLVRVFSATGGLIDAEELAGRLQWRTGQGVGVVARWIVDRKAVHFLWHGSYWLPCFQFFQPALALRPSLVGILAELSPLVSDGDVALWFASPNEALADSIPAALLASCPADVLQAARRRTRLDASAAS